MKKFLTAALLFIAVTAGAQTVPQTPFLHLNLPPHGYQPYDTVVNPNFTTIDTWAQTVANSLQTQFKGTWGSGTVYSQGQSVLYGGDYYISVINTNGGNIPTHTSLQWAWAGTTNSSTVAFPVGIPYTTSGGSPITRTMVVGDLMPIFGTTFGGTKCWLNNAGTCDIPPAGYTPANKVMWTDPTTHASTTATAQQMASMFMKTDGATACTDGVLMGDGTCYPLTPNQAIVSDSNGKTTSLGERGVTCTGSEPQTCKVAWDEDQSQGIFDPRRPRTFDNGAGTPVTLASDCTQAIVNTVNAAMCAQQSNPNILPIVRLPAGRFTGCGKNTQLPPGITMIGQPGLGPGDYGGTTRLQSGDATQPMFVEVGSYTATCGGTPITITGGGQRFEHISLSGNGIINKNDTGLVDASLGSTYTYDAAFTGFGGPGAQIRGLNSHGDKVFAAQNLWWYYFSGGYNPGSSFVDSSWHASLELTGQDGQWDHVVEYGALQDTGWYNRYYLVGVVTPGGPSSRLEDSFIQINPHNVIATDNSDGGRRIHHNRFDDSWFSSIQTGFFGGGHIGDNDITGYCTSPLLNPANFPTNPTPGVSPDPNCSAIMLADGGNSMTYWNDISESPGTWPAWPTYQIFQADNNTGQSGAAAGIVEQPGDTVGGAFGSNWCCGNQGSDASRSIVYTTARKGNFGAPITNGTIDLGVNVGVNMSSSSTSTWNNIISKYPDFVARIFLGSLDSIVPSSTVSTCNSQVLTGSDTGSFKGGTTGYLFWMRDKTHATQINCVSGPPAPQFSSTDPAATACTTSSPSIVYGLFFATGCNLTFHTYLPLVQQTWLQTRFDEFVASTDAKATRPLLGPSTGQTNWAYSNNITDGWQYQSGGGLLYTGTIASGDDIVWMTGSPLGTGTFYAIRGSINSNAQAGEIVLRYTDDQNFVAMRMDDTGIITLVSVTTGTPTTLYTGTHPMINGGDFFLQVNGQQLSGFYNIGDGVGNYSMSGVIPAGKNTSSAYVGLGTWTATDNAFKVNNFTVSNE